GPVDLASYDALLSGKEADDGGGDVRSARGAGEQLEGVAPAGVPVGLRRAGPAGAAGGAELRAVPAGPGPTRVPGAAAAPHRASAAGVAPAAGEELVGVGPEAPAGPGGAAGALAAGGVVRGPARERPDIRSSRIGKDAYPLRAGPGAG